MTAALQAKSINASSPNNALAAGRTFVNHVVLCARYAFSIWLGGSGDWAAAIAAVLTIMASDKFRVRCTARIGAPRANAVPIGRSAGFILARDGVPTPQRSKRCNSVTSTAVEGSPRYWGSTRTCSGLLGLIHPRAHLR